MERKIEKKVLTSNKKKGGNGVITHMQIKSGKIKIKIIIKTHNYISFHNVISVT